MVKYRHCGHRFNNRNSTRQYTWIVTSTSCQRGSLPINIDSILCLQNSSYRFESHSEIDVLSVGNTSLYASAMISLSGNTRQKHVVLLRTSLVGTSKTLAILKALDCIDAKHGST